MFSSLGAIFVNKLRHAETTDTRQHIRHHDPDFERSKKKKDKNEQETAFDEDDNAIVSIEALRVFLKNFLHSADQSPETQNTPPQPEKLQEKQPPTKNTGPAAHAAHAYQHSAEAGGHTNFNMPDQENPAGIAHSLGLDAQDVRTIHALLDDLKTLSDRKIEYLNIERGESFLQSLVDSVSKVKADIPARP